MKLRDRRRVDWDEEMRKTEGIRRKGFFISAMSFCAVMVFGFGAARLKGSGVELDRKVIFAACLLAAAFVVRCVLRRRERLRRERQEMEEEMALRRLLRKGGGE